MTLNGMSSHFVVPVFFFLAITLLFITVVCIFAAFHSNVSYLIVGCLSFILGYNSMLVGLKIKNGA